MTQARSVTASFVSAGTGSVATATLSGLWYNRDQSGHGFGITAVAPGVIAMTWYTYTTEGFPTWIVSVLTEVSPNEYSGRGDYYQGMRFGTFSPSTNATFPWGSVVVRFSSCTRATVNYNGTLTFTDGSTFGTGTIELERLAAVEGGGCAAPGSTKNQQLASVDRGISGLWYNRTQTGHGFEFTAVAPGVAAVTWYTYTTSGYPVWVAGVVAETSPTVLSGDVFYYQGMRFGVFSPASNASYRWGTLSFDFDGCDRAVASYNGTLVFQDGEGFGTGSVPIEKLASFLGVPCTTGN